MKSDISSHNYGPLAVADPRFFGWRVQTRAKPLCESLSAKEGDLYPWKKNGNQIILRCPLKHYKIRIFLSVYCV